MKKPRPGTRVRHHSLGPATVIASDDCEVLKKHSDQNQKWRDSFNWFKFDDGSINGWSTMGSFISILTLEDKVEAARQALADAEAELAASKWPKPGDRYSSRVNNTTATVKAVVDDVIYYEYVGKASGTKDYAGRIIESFRRTYETKLADCDC